MAVLNEVLSDKFGLSVEACQELKNANGYLCVQCQNLLLKSEKLKNELQKTLNTIKEKLDSLHFDSLAPSSISSGRKRLLTESLEAEPDTEPSISDTDLPSSPTITIPAPSPIATPDASVSSYIALYLCSS